MVSMFVIQEGEFPMGSELLMCMTVGFKRLTMNPYSYCTLNSPLWIRQKSLVQFWCVPLGQQILSEWYHYFTLKDFFLMHKKGREHILHCFCFACNPKKIYLFFVLKSHFIKVTSTPRRILCGSGWNNIWSRFIKKLLILLWYVPLVLRV